MPVFRKLEFIELKDYGVRETKGVIRERPSREREDLWSERRHAGAGPDC